LLTTKIVYFVKLSKYETDFTTAFLSSRWSKNIYMERLIQNPGKGVNCPLALCGNQNLSSPTRTSDFHIGVLALREHQNF
jgi:hypothetical protein